MNNELPIKPNYLIDDLVYSFKNRDFKNIDKMIIENYFNILMLSEKYLFSNQFENYIYEFENYFNGKIDENFNDLPINFTIEYINPYTNKPTLINFIHFKNPLFKKLANFLGQPYSLTKKNSYLMSFFEKNENDWGMPYQSIIINEDGTYESIKTFSKPKNNKNDDYNYDDIVNDFFEGLFDIFKSAIFFFSDQEEYIYIPPIYKNKKNKGYTYKISQTFLQPPKKNIKTDQGVSMSIKNKNKKFDANKQKIYNSFFIK